MAFFEFLAQNTCMKPSSRINNGEGVRPQVYTRLTLTVGTCYVVIIQWGFPRIIMLGQSQSQDLGTHQSPLLLLSSLTISFFVLLPQASLIYVLCVYRLSLILSVARVAKYTISCSHHHLKPNITQIRKDRRQKSVYRIVTAPESVTPEIYLQRWDPSATPIG